MSFIKAFFFDLDGTLVNTYEADFLAYQDAILEVTGFSITQPDFAKTNGKEMRYKLAELTPGISEDKILQIGAQKKLHYAKYLHLTIPNKPLIAFLQAQARDQKAVLVTSAKRHNATMVLKAHSLIGHFSEMIFGDDISNPKPHPEPYLLALKRMDLRSDEALAFEDSDTGALSATAAGIKVIRIRNFE